MNTESLEGIQSLWSTFPSISQDDQDTETTSGGMFADIFQNAIEDVKTTDAEKNQEEYLLATGQLDNTADLTIASTKAQLSVDLLVQLRNRALDAYSELTRISL